MCIWDLKNNILQKNSSISDKFFDVINVGRFIIWYIGNEKDNEKKYC